MPRRLLLALLVLVAAPLVLLGWVSASAMRDSQENAKKQITSLLRSRLVEIDRSTASLFDEYERRIGIAIEKETPAIDTLKKLRRSDPVVRQGVFVSPDGQLLYPPRPSLDDPDAVALYAALPGMISGRPELIVDFDSQLAANNSLGSAKSEALRSKVQPLLKTLGKSSRSMVAPSAKLAPPSKASGKTLEATADGSVASSTQPMRGNRSRALSGRSMWQVWYLDQGMQLILWLPQDDGAAAGVILERPRWTSDLTAVLPDSNQPGANEGDAMPGFTALVDEAKQTVYRWGDEGRRNAQPIASLPMSAPLASWQWEFHNTAPLIPPSSTLPLLLSLAGLAVVLVALGGYVLSSVQRQMRAARNRVSFAGQVSHELRTPLTNIRLYAELAESDLEDLPPSDVRDSMQRRLNVIDSESKRLGRLVSGVLEMIRDGKKRRGPRLASVNPDHLISETLAQFAPSFSNAGIEVDCETETDQFVQLDADIFEMVLVNLLSNVEKYAGCGRYVGIRSSVVDDHLVVRVSDRGPGVGRRHQRVIFRPFARLDDSISAPSGTGIGLTIARKAAMRHGGQLELVPTDRGACFELRIPVVCVVASTETPAAMESNES